MKTKIDQLENPHAREFARDCFDMKSVVELKVPHSPSNANPDDLSKWNLTPEAWSEAIDAALYDLLEETNSLFQKTLTVDEDIALGRWCASCQTPWGIVTSWGSDREEALKKLHDNIMGVDGNIESSKSTK